MSWHDEGLHASGQRGTLLTNHKYSSDPCPTFFGYNFSLEYLTKSTPQNIYQAMLNMLLLCHHSTGSEFWGYYGSKTFDSLEERVHDKRMIIQGFVSLSAISNFTCIRCSRWCPLAFRHEGVMFRHLGVMLTVIHTYCQPHLVDLYWNQAAMFI